MKPPTVYIIQDMGNKDFGPALLFGQPEVLLSSDLPVYGDTSPVLERLAQKLAQFDPQFDSVLATGDPVAIGAVFALLARAGHPWVTVLKWNRQTRTYTLLRLTFPPRKRADTK
jgi:hypothetical protein